MSWNYVHAVMDAIQGDVDLTANERLALLNIAYYANEKNNGEAWPGWETLARSCALSRTAIYTATRGLAGKGLLELVGRRNRSRYRLVDPQCSPGEHSAALQCSSREHSVFTTRTPSGHDANTQCSPHEHEPSSEPEREPEERTAPPGGGGQGGGRVVRMKRPERDPARNATGLVEYFNDVVIKHMIRNYDRRPVGARDLGVSAGRINRLVQTTGMEFVEIKELMDLYKDSPTFWNKARHPMDDFLSPNMIELLRNSREGTAVGETEYEPPRGPSLAERRAIEARAIRAAKRAAQEAEAAAQAARASGEN